MQLLVGEEGRERDTSGISTTSWRGPSGLPHVVLGSLEFYLVQLMGSETGQVSSPLQPSDPVK